MSLIDDIKRDRAEGHPQTDLEAALLAADRAIEAFETCNPLDDKQLDEIDAAISAYREATK